MGLFWVDADARSGDYTVSLVISDDGGGPWRRVVFPALYSRDYSMIGGKLMVIPSGSVILYTSCFSKITESQYACAYRLDPKTGVAEELDQSGTDSRATYSYFSGAVWDEALRRLVLYGSYGMDFQNSTGKSFVRSVQIQ